MTITKTQPNKNDAWKILEVWRNLVFSSAGPQSGRVDYIKLKKIN